MDFRAIDGWPLRTMIWCPQNAHRTIVLLNGRGDFIEKYSELISDLVAKRYAVATLDWRGQGLSGEITPPPRRTHIENFNLWSRDAQHWLEAVVTIRCPAPLYLLGHSMGGHLGLRLLHDMPDVFARALLLAPMLGLRTQPFSTKFARRIAALVVGLGQGERLGFGQMAYSPFYQTEIRMNRLTSDKARFDQEAAMIATNPALAIGGVTYGWVRAAFDSCDLLASPGYAEAIATPTLILAAERELLVDNDASKAFAARLPHGQFELIADGRHELFRERDAIRESVLSKIYKFYE